MCNSHNAKYDYIAIDGVKSIGNYTVSLILTKALGG